MSGFAIASPRNKPCAGRKYGRSFSRHKVICELKCWQRFFSKRFRKFDEWLGSGQRLSSRRFRATETSPYSSFERQFNVRCSAQFTDCGGRMLPAREEFRSSEFRRDPVFFKRNTTVQVWTIGEGFGIGSERTCCAVNNFRDHDLMSPLNSLPLPDPTHALWIGSDISPI